MNVVYDAGVLVAADRDERGIWADHRARLEAGTVPITTACVVAQVSSSGRQVTLRRFLRGCDVVGFGPDQAHEVGSLLARTATSDVVDAHLTLTASRTPSMVLTADVDDIETLAGGLPATIRVQRV